MIEKRDPKRLLDLRDSARDGGYIIDAELLGRGGAINTVTQCSNDPQVVPGQLADSFSDILFRAGCVCRDWRDTSR